jgi:hypothetical protein
MATTTQQGVVQETTALPILNEADAEQAFLDRWTEEDSPEETSEKPEVKQESEPVEEEDTESTEETEESSEDETDPEDDQSETEEETEEESEESQEEKSKKTLDDEDEVEIKVNDEVKKVSVKELKRLWGQEAALTRKSQEVAAKRKEVEQTEAKYAASLQKLYEKAASRWEPYSKIDMLVASKQLDADQFTALRQEAQAAYEEFRFISEEADQFVKQTEVARQEQMKVAAQEAVKVLKEAIPNWNSQLYDNIREYAISNGMPPEVVNNLVDPVAIQLIHKARLFDESKKIATQKKVNTPKKVVKTTNASSAKDFKPNDKAKLVQQARMGDTDDVANLFLSRWQE